MIGLQSGGAGATAHLQARRRAARRFQCRRETGQAAAYDHQPAAAGRILGLDRHVERVLEAWQPRVEEQEGAGKTDARDAHKQKLGKGAV